MKKVLYHSKPTMLKCSRLASFATAKAGPSHQSMLVKDTLHHLHTNQSFQLHSLTGLPKEAPDANFKATSDLPWGEIPFELNFDRKTETTTLSNGISVTNIDYISPVVTISVFIRCGSVDENETASGAAHFLEHMHFKGTPKRTKSMLELEIENQGAHLNAYTTRDYTSYILNVFQDKVDWGVELLSDILTRSVYKQELIDRERDTIFTELLECQREEFETVLENSHYTVFKNHSIARPILGLKENIMSVTRDQIVEFHTRNYTGENILFTVAGNIEHGKMVEFVNKHFGKIEKSREVTDEELLRNRLPPEFMPRTTLIDGPDGNLKAGLFWNAPDWSGGDYMSFLMLQRIVGDYKKLNFEVGKVVPSPSKISSLVSPYPQIETIRPAYTPYRNSGLFGCFVECEPQFGPEALAFVRSYFNDLADNLQDEDILRARSQVFSELMAIEIGTDITQDLGVYLVYTHRTISKSEVAKRLSLAADTNLIKSTIKKWLVNKPCGITLWGPYKEAEAAASAHLPWNV
jgi:predicted Zn-dependent peptidase